MSSSVASKDYGVETSTTYKRKQEEKDTAKSGKTSHSDFLKLLTVQLTNQDPLNPMEDIDFTGQLAQLQALDEQMEMTKSMKAMRIDTQVQAGTNMIGKYVSGTDSADSNVTGIVNRVVQNSDGVFVELAGGKRVAISNINNVWNDANDMMNDVGNAGAMVGMWVESVDSDGNQINGIVNKVTIEDGTYKLLLYGGKTVDYGQVKAMRPAVDNDQWYLLPDAIRVKVEDASRMINMTITGTDDKGEKVTGMVGGADYVNGKVVLTLYSGEKIDYDTIEGKPRESTKEEVATGLNGYWLEGLGTNGDDVAGLVVGAFEDDSGIGVILDDGSRLYLDSVQGLREAKDEDRSRLHGKVVAGKDQDGNEVEGIVTEKLMVDKDLAVKLDNGSIILCKDITSVKDAPKKEGEKEDESKEK